MTGLISLLLLGLALLLLLMWVMLAWGLTHPPRLTAGVAAARDLPLDPDELGLMYEDWVLARPGADLPVWDLRNPENPRGSIIIITHPWGGSRHTSLERVTLIWDEASRVILWDMRGHGDASPGGSKLGAEEIDDLRELIEAVADPPGPNARPLILYGMSMGAGVSIGAAAENPRVHGVIADGPYRWTGEPIRAILRLSGLPVTPITMVCSRWLAYRLPRLREYDRARAAARLTCPLLVLHGADDPICSIDSALEISEAAPDAELIVVPRATHLDLHSTDEARYRMTMRAFIRRCRHQHRIGLDAPAESA